MGEQMLNPETGEVIQRTADPVINPTYATPSDFTAQYPVPLDTTEILAFCEEITVSQTIPRTGYASE